jgi:glycosyltransferase involved in cell wall biosynthesis
MRILIAGQTYYPGTNGQAVFTIRLAEAMAANGHEVMCVVPNEQFQSAHIKINHVHVEKRPSINAAIIHTDTFVNIPWDGGIGRLVDEFQPEVVHIQDFYPIARVVLRAAKKRNLPVIGTNHFLPGNLLCYFPRLLQGQYVSDLLWKIMLSAYNQVDLITAPTVTGANILCQQPVKVEVIAVSNGIRLDRFKPDPSIDRSALCHRYNLDPEKKLFLFVGRLEEEKRASLLIDGVSKLKREDVQLAIGGRGTQREKLLHQIQKLGLQGKVFLLGFVPQEDLPALLNSVDFFCMPSAQELQSIATLEALACGRPVIAANARALPELVHHGKNGYLFEPDNVDSLVNCMRAILDSPQDWQRMGQASLQIAQGHALQKSIERYIELYQMVVERKRAIR